MEHVHAVVIGYVN